MTQKRWYHGSLRLQPGTLDGEDLCCGRSDGSNYLFASASVNVACRYGTPFEIGIEGQLEDLPRVSVVEWLDNKPVPAQSFIITREPDSYDWPEDTLVIVTNSVTSISFTRLTDKAIAEADDGHAYTHEPESPDSRQFSDFIRDFYDGDIEAWENEQQACPALTP